MANDVENLSSYLPEQPQESDNKQLMKPVSNELLLSSELLNLDTPLESIRIFHGTPTEVELYPKSNARTGDIIFGSTGMKIETPIHFYPLVLNTTWMLTSPNDEIVFKKNPKIEEVIQVLNAGGRVRRDDIWLVYVIELKFFYYIDFHRSWRRIPIKPSFFIPASQIIRRVLLQSIAFKKKPTFLLTTKQVSGRDANGNILKFYAFEVVPEGFLSQEDEQNIYQMLSLIKSIPSVAEVDIAPDNDVEPLPF